MLFINLIALYELIIIPLLIIISLNPWWDGFVMEFFTVLFLAVIVLTKFLFSFWSWLFFFSLTLFWFIWFFYNLFILTNLTKILEQIKFYSFYFSTTFFLSFPLIFLIFFNFSKITFYTISSEQIFFLLLQIILSFYFIIIFNLKLLNIFKYQNFDLFLLALKQNINKYYIFIKNNFSCFLFIGFYIINYTTSFSYFCNGNFEQNFLVISTNSSNPKEVEFLFHSFKDYDNRIIDLVNNNELNSKISSYWNEFIKEFKVWLDVFWYNEYNFKLDYLFNSKIHLDKFDLYKSNYYSNNNESNYNIISSEIRIIDTSTTAWNDYLLNKFSPTIKFKKNEEIEFYTCGGKGSKLAGTPAKKFAESAQPPFRRASVPVPDNNNPAPVKESLNKPQVSKPKVIKSEISKSDFLNQESQFKRPEESQFYSLNERRLLEGDYSCLETNGSQDSGALRRFVDVVCYKHSIPKEKGQEILTKLQGETLNPSEVYKRFLNGSSRNIDEGIAGIILKELLRPGVTNRELIGSDRVGDTLVVGHLDPAKHSAVHISNSAAQKYAPHLDDVVIRSHDQDKIFNVGGKVFNGNSYKPHTYESIKSNLLSAYKKMNLNNNRAEEVLKKQDEILKYIPKEDHDAIRPFLKLNYCLCVHVDSEKVAEHVSNAIKALNLQIGYLEIVEIDQDAMQNILLKPNHCYIIKKKSNLLSLEYNVDLIIKNARQEIITLQRSDASNDFNRNIVIPEIVRVDFVGSRVGADIIPGSQISRLRF